jgi:hypothetical protein
MLAGNHFGLNYRISIMIERIYISGLHIQSRRMPAYSDDSIRLTNVGEEIGKEEAFPHSISGKLKWPEFTCFYVVGLQRCLFVCSSDVPCNQVNGYL